MAEDHHHADPPPTALLAQAIPEGFLRHVGVPDDEVLREGHVGVEDRESQQQRPDVIEVRREQHVLERTSAA